MKTKIIQILILSTLTLGALTEARAQRNVYTGSIELSEPDVIRKDSRLTITVKANLSGLSLQRQQMVTLTPVLRLREPNNSYTYIFDPVVVAGNVRYKALERGLRLGNFTFDNAPSEIVRRRNKTGQDAVIQVSIPFEEWMRRAELVFIEEVSGCAGCGVAYAEHIMDNLLPPAFVPNYTLVIETPPVEQVKTRSETHSAAMNFIVGRYELLRNYKNNAEVLDEADRIVKEVMNDPDLSFTDLRVDGYASPEGNFNSNMRLSDNRAMAFVKYLHDKHGIPENMITHTGHGEDWEGLRKAVAASDMPAKQSVLDIIDSNDDIEVRKNKLHALNGGSTYRYLLSNYYPPLRRNVYTFTYIARPFNLEEAREMINTRPDLLSLNEMYLVANSYPSDSQEYYETFRTALEYFPDDMVAANNLAALEIEAGNINEAIGLLSNLDSAAAHNNRGVAYARMGSVEKAEEYFRLAAAAGSEEGVYNLDQLFRWKADM